MNKEIPKTYNPQEVEDKIYKMWEESGAFNPDNLKLKKNAKAFSVAMPPPNVTGILHLGHALENSLMDTMVRFQRMRGRRALLVPGTDHAAVATQARVESDLVRSGKYKNPREELGREKLLEIIREYAEESKVAILSQIRKMGTSCDWSRLSYTFDEARGLAVNKAFAKMHKDGLIYRGYRVINWSVKGQSTCSDDELVYVERPAKLYTFKYSKDFPIPIATTRPETKLGDTAVAVHPDDERYKKYIGQIFTCDVGAKDPLKIKIVGDSSIDPEFGTGAVGVTPAHSMIDYDMRTRHGLNLVQVIGKDGKMTAEAGKDYAGLTALEAREKFVSYLKKEGSLEKEEDIIQNVGTSDRFGDVVEVIPMTQWFVDVNKEIPGTGKSLKDLMREAVTIGHNGKAKQKIIITPERFGKIYLNWIDNLRDWCISRQMWWGHRIPAWYRNKLKIKNEKLKIEENNSKDQEIYVGVEPPDGEGWFQDPDTLDTWFSSGLWTFSTLGWPNETEDFKNFHPTSWMQMGSDIIFFWMARMILMSTYLIDDIPFKDVYIHGLLRDKDGRKFSKSLGNGIDPLDIIKKYGTDAFRLSLIIGTTPGNDARFFEEKVEGYRNLVNKLWNISRYILMSAEEVRRIKKIPEANTLADQWILGRLTDLMEFSTANLEKYNFSAVGERLYEFTWNDFADWYIEISKIEKEKNEILLYILERLLILWHPFMPFATEEIWKNFNSGNPLMTEDWPDKARKIGNGEEAEGNFDLVKKIITSIRALRSENKIEPVKKIKAVIISRNKAELIGSQSEIIRSLARLSDLAVCESFGDKKGMISAILPEAEVYLSLLGLIDKEKEKKALEKEIAETSKYVDSVEKKLENKSFVSNAPASIVEKERNKCKEGREKLKKLEKKLKNLL